MKAPSKLKCRTTNWKEYNAALKARGSLLIWLGQDMCWHGSASGKHVRSRKYSEAAIRFCLTIKALFNLALRFPQVVLVPTWINNVQRVMPKGEVVPVPVLCSVSFGAPIEVQPGEERRPFLDRARGAVLALREI